MKLHLLIGRHFLSTVQENKTIKMNNHHKEVSGQIIDLISPSFPCNSTGQKEPYNLTCIVSTERSDYFHNYKYQQLKILPPVFVQSISMLFP